MPIPLAIVRLRAPASSTVRRSRSTATVTSRLPVIARLCAARSIAATSRAAALASTPGMAWVNIGTASVTVNLSITSTTSSSSSVKPSASARLPALDVTVLALAALLAVRAQGVEVVVAVLARGPVEVGPTPGIGQGLAVLEIGTVPHGRLRRTIHQRRQPLLIGRIAADFEVIEVEHAAELLDLDLRRIDLGGPEILDESRRRDRHQQSKDRQHHQQLDQRVAFLPMSSIATRHHGRCIPLIARDGEPEV